MPINLLPRLRRFVPTPSQVIPIFIGYDPRERAATNVLIDSLYQFSSVPLAITPLVTPQLEKQGLYRRERDPKQSTAFSFTRFLVPHLMDYSGWAISWTATCSAAVTSRGCGISVMSNTARCTSNRLCG